MDIVAIIVICIICIQIYFFVSNLLRMIEFKNIFSQDGSWRLIRNPETEFVSGIGGTGNKIFDAIRESINKYLGNNAGSVIDFGLLKDAVDRHCDSVENDISTQTPIPLYCGLAGTMAGVIIGLWDLLSSNSISALMGSTVGGIDAASSGAAAGINSLLNGVAWAMLASICGILLTTINSLLFKNYKLKEESGKNGFLAWMQSKLLPELPSDTSEALNNLVKNLNAFNRTFATNTGDLGEALEKVNDSYKIQAEVIKYVHDMDVMKMAKANVRVLTELKECTDKLQDFNHYLDDIRGYTDAIHRFEEQFQSEVDRIHVLEEIRDFFERHKGSMSKVAADIDDGLKLALSGLNETTSTNVDELKNRLVEQSTAFKEMMKQEKDIFEDFAGQMKTQFNAQLSQMPNLGKRLEQISDIPVRLDKLIESIERSNSRMVEDIQRTMNDTAHAISKRQSSIQGIEINGPQVFPKWMQWIFLSCVLLITIMGGFFVVYNIFTENTPARIVEYIPQTEACVQEVRDIPVTQNDNNTIGAASFAKTNSDADATDDIESSTKQDSIDVTTDNLSTTEETPKNSI